MPWSKAEKKIARQVFDRAYEQECADLLEKVREMAASAQGPDDLWAIEDFLDDKRHEIARKYDYRYSQLIVVFGLLVREGRLTLDDLDGLREDKLEKIDGIANFVSRCKNDTA
jgi:hypothetical protein